jgi:hypothetical protein
MKNKRLLFGKINLSIADAKYFKHWPAGFALGMAFLLGPAYGEDIQREKNIVATESLEQRGKQLRAEVELAWKKIKGTPELLRIRNDISATVAKYFPIGTSFDEAEVILFSAGFNILSRPNSKYPSNNPDKYDLVVNEESIKLGVRPSNDPHKHDLIAAMGLEKSWVSTADITIVLSPENLDVGQSKVGQTQGIIIYSSL